jgi:hypothetical protein
MPISLKGRIVSVRGYNRLRRNLVVKDMFTESGKGRDALYWYEEPDVELCFDCL